MISPTKKHKAKVRVKGNSKQKLNHSTSFKYCVIYSFTCDKKDCRECTFLE